MRVMTRDERRRVNALPLETRDRLVVNHAAHGCWNKIDAVRCNGCNRPAAGKRLFRKRQKTRGDKFLISPACTMTFRKGHRRFSAKKKKCRALHVLCTQIAAQSPGKRARLALNVRLFGD